MPEIFDLNTYILDRMQQAFGEDTVLISSIGNNGTFPSRAFSVEITLTKRFVLQIFILITSCLVLDVRYPGATFLVPSLNTR